MPGKGRHTHPRRQPEIGSTRLNSSHRCISYAVFCSILIPMITTPIPYTTLFRSEEIQKRSYPNGFGGQHSLQGYELVESLDLMRNAPLIAEEAAVLHSVSQCPEKVGTLILGGSQRSEAHV